MEKKKERKKNLNKYILPNTPKNKTTNLRDKLHEKLPSGT